LAQSTLINSDHSITMARPIARVRSFPGRVVGFVFRVNLGIRLRMEAITSQWTPRDIGCSIQSLFIWYVLAIWSISKQRWALSIILWTINIAAD